MYEIQPDIKWNKGSAVIWLLEMLGLITDVASQKKYDDNPCSIVLFNNNNLSLCG